MKPQFFKVIFLLSLVLASCALLLSLTLKPPLAGPAAWYERAFFAMLKPVYGLTHAVSEHVRSGWQRYFNLVHIAEENSALRKSHAYLEAQQLRFEHLAAENERLRVLLELPQRYHWKLQSAEVIAYSPRGDFALLTINRGMSDGLSKRMPVVAAKGLVGQIYRLGSDTAQVLLLNDPSSVVDVRLPETGARGLLRGRLQSTTWARDYYLTSLEYLDRMVPVLVGGIVETTGLDGVFPSGIPVGMIHNVNAGQHGMFQEATIVPLVDVFALQEVFVVTEWETHEK